MPLYWIFLILAIVVALYSNKIDAAANASKKLKKWLIVICAFLAITSIVLIIKSLGVITETISIILGIHMTYYLYNIQLDYSANGSTFYLLN